MNYSDVLTAIQEAKHTQNLGDELVHNIARLCCGRLEISEVPSWTLCELKKELRNFDAHRKCWMEH